MAYSGVTRPCVELLDVTVADEGAHHPLQVKSSAKQDVDGIPRLPESGSRETDTQASSRMALDELQPNGQKLHKPW
jgi:hypothetical protein